VPAGAEAEVELAAERHDQGHNQDVVMAGAGVPDSGDQDAAGDGGCDARKAVSMPGTASASGEMDVDGNGSLEENGHVVDQDRPGAAPAPAAVPAGPNDLEQPGQAGSGNQRPNGTHAGHPEQQPPPAGTSTAARIAPAGKAGLSGDTLQLWGYTLPKEVRQPKLRPAG
jgi:hypothetical protein